MGLQVEKLDNNMVKVTIEVEPEKLDAAIKHIIRRNHSSAYLDSEKEKYLKTLLKKHME